MQRSSPLLANRFNFWICLFAGDFVGHQRRHGCMRVPIDATKTRISAVLLAVRAHIEHNQCCVTGIRPDQGFIRAVEQRECRSIGFS